MTSILIFKWHEPGPGVGVGVTVGVRVGVLVGVAVEVGVSVGVWVVVGVLVGVGVGVETPDGVMFGSTKASATARLRSTSTSSPC